MWMCETEVCVGCSDLHFLWREQTTRAQKRHGKQWQVSEGVGMELEHVVMETLLQVWGVVDNDGGSWFYRNTNSWTLQSFQETKPRRYVAEPEQSGWSGSKKKDLVLFKEQQHLKQSQMYFPPTTHTNDTSPAELRFSSFTNSKIYFNESLESLSSLFWAPSCCWDDSVTKIKHEILSVWDVCVYRWYVSFRFTVRLSLCCHVWYSGRRKQKQKYLNSTSLNNIYINMLHWSSFVLTHTWSSYTDWTYIVYIQTTCNPNRCYHAYDTVNKHHIEMMHISDSHR